MGRKAREAAECALFILLRSALEAGEIAGFPISTSVIVYPQTLQF